MTAHPILLVDDEPMILEAIADILEDEGGFQVFCAENAESARKRYQEVHPDVVLLDIWMPDCDGISLLREWQELPQRSMTIMMSGHGNIETAVEATKLGAYDFLEKPLSAGKMMLAINRALKALQLERQNRQLKRQIDPPLALIGQSEVMTALRAEVERLAGQNVPVLLWGGAGVGKAHIAHYLHQHSARAEAPFVRSNLAASERALIAQNLNALMGQAEGGTLYLDEVTLLPKTAQNALLEVLDYGTFPLEGQHLPVDLRLLFATHTPPALLGEKLIPAFLDRLQVATLNIPDLKDHSGDIPELLDYFTRHFADVEEMPYRHFDLAAQNFLRQHFWLGNVRELRNFVQRLLLKGEEAEIGLEEAKAALSPAESEQADAWMQFIPRDLSLREARELFERHYLLEHFRHCDGNIAQLAGRVGMDRTNLYRKLRKLKIDPIRKPESP